MSSNPSKAVLVDLYRRMTLIKQNDERFRATIKAGKIVAPYYSPRGQEVIPSAVSVNLRDTDYICTIYRGVHDMLAKGVPMKQLWAEIAGKADAHYFVYKEIVKDQVKTNIRQLSTEERITSIAKMLSGEKPTAAAMENAREMLMN